MEDAFREEIYFDLQVIWLATICMVWKVHNARIYMNSEIVMDQLLQQIKLSWW